MGPCAGGAVYSPAITDFVYQVDGASHMFITGPDVIKAVTGEEVTFEELGGAATHAGTSGVTHFIADSGKAALDEVRYLLSFLPQNNMETPPYFTPSDSPDRIEDALDSIIPDSPNQPYDMVSIIESVVDNGEFLPGPRPMGPKHRGGIRPPQWSLDRSCRQSTGLPGRHTEHLLLREGRPVRSNM